jgi:hypothetical protein
MTANETSTLLDDILDVLGYGGRAAPVKLTDDLTGAEGAPEADADSNRVEADRLDRLDRQNSTDITKYASGRFEVGRRYRTDALQRVVSTAAGLREQLDQAGFVRGGIVEVEGVGLLVGDVARLLVDGSFLVLGFAELPGPKPRPGGRKNTRDR